MVEQFQNLNRDKKGGVADGEPAGPTDAKHQPDPFHEGEEAVNQSADSDVQPSGLGERAHLVARSIQNRFSGLRCVQWLSQWSTR